MIVYRASGLGYCTKRQVALRMDYEPMPVPEDMQKIFDAGNEAEEQCVSLLMDKGRDIFNQQLEVALQITDEIAVVGHIDGQERTLLGDVGIEIKSMSENVYATVPHNHDIWDFAPLYGNYKWQLSVYILALGVPFNVIFWRRRKEDTDVADFFELTIEKPFYTEAEIRARVLGIESQARQGIMPEFCDNKGYPCPVYYVTKCAGEVEWGNEEIAALGLTYKKLVEEKKLVEAREKQTRKLLLDAARGDSDAEIVEKKVATDDVSVSFYKGRSKPSVNWEQLLLDFQIDKKDHETPGSEYQAIRVTVKNKPDE